MGAFAVTTGHGVPELVEKFKKDHDDYNAIMTKALADRLAEAFAEYLHEQVRTRLWGYAPDEDLDNDQLIREKYTGRSEEHTSELQSRGHLVCRLLLEKKKKNQK